MSLLVRWEKRPDAYPIREVIQVETHEIFFTSVDRVWRFLVLHRCLVSGRGAFDLPILSQ